MYIFLILWSVDGHLGVCMFWLLWLVLQWTQQCMYLFEYKLGFCLLISYVLHFFTLSELLHWQKSPVKSLIEMVRANILIWFIILGGKHCLSWLIMILVQESLKMPFNRLRKVFYFQFTESCLVFFFNQKWAAFDKLFFWICEYDIFLC